MRSFSRGACYDRPVRARSNGRLASALALVLSAAACGGAMPEPTPRSSPPILVRPAFLVGYDEGWFGTRYGSDLTRDYDGAGAARTLDAIAAAGGRAVRLWLFEGREGLVREGRGPSLRGLDPALVAHLGEVLAMARARSLFVYLAALDGNDMPAEAGDTRAFYTHLLNAEEGEAEAYETVVLRPVLAVLARHRDVVLGLDLVNEIAAARARGYFADPESGPRAYLARTAAFVKREAPWLALTASAGWDGAATEIARGAFSGLGLDFFELHAYADDGRIDDLEALCARAKAEHMPVLLGELGQKTRSDDDALQAAATGALLRTARGSCFMGALAWRFDAAEPHFRFARSDGSLRPAAAVIRAAATADPEENRR